MYLLSKKYDSRFLNGSILEPTTVNIISNGTTVNVVLTSLAANNKLSLIFDEEYVSVANGISIDLILGTAMVPVENWVYIDPTGNIQTSISGFPTLSAYIPIIRVVCPSAAIAQTYGVYKGHVYADHLEDNVNQGHLSHLNAWIRKKPAVWQSGLALSQSVSEGTPAADIQLSYTSGIISQLLDHTFPAYDTDTKPAFIINDNATPYEIANGITPAINEDSEGNSVDNEKYYNLVVWGVISQETKDCKLFFNLSSGSYTNEFDAINDVDITLNYSIPLEYIGTGFLLTKLTILRTSTTVTVVIGGTKDLRETLPGVGGGLTSDSGVIVFDHLIDTPITKVGETLKHIRVNAEETALEYIAINNLYTETPTGTINGTNKQFTVTKVFIAGSTSVYLNGLKQKIDAGNDYIEDGGLSSITFEVAPKNIEFTDTIEIVYQSIQ